METSAMHDVLAKLTEYPFLKVEWRGELRLEGGWAVKMVIFILV